MAPPVGLEFDDASVDEGSVATAQSIGSDTLVNELSDAEEPPIGPTVIEIDEGCCRAKFKDKKEGAVTRTCALLANRCRREGRRDQRNNG